MISVSALAIISGSNFSSVSAQEKGNQGTPPATQNAPDATQGNQNNREPEMKRGADIKAGPESPAGTNEKGKKGNLQRAQDQNGERKGKIRSDSKPENKAQSQQRAGEKPAKDSSPSASDSSPNKGSTTGQGAAGSTKLSAEQRTKISATIKQQNVRRQANVNFTIAIGSRVPRSGVKFYALPATVISFYPEWRGYEYILVGDEIVVINPRTMEIVDVIPA
jgi:hypothetical protein